MRILHLSNLYAPIIGGLERNVSSTCEELVRRGHHVTVATVQVPGAPPNELRNGVRVIRLRGTLDRLGGWLYADPAKPLLPTFGDPLITERLKSLMNREPFDLVHTHDWMMHSFRPLQRKHPDLAHVHTAHDYGLVCPKRSLMYTGPRGVRGHCTGPGLKKCLKCAPDQYGVAKGVLLTLGQQASARLPGRVDALLVLSHPMLTDLGRSPATLRSPDPIVVPSFVPDNAEDLALDTPRPDWLPHRYFLFVGALGALKGLDVLIRAYEDLLIECAAADDLPGLVCIGTPTPHSPAIPDGVVVRQNVGHPEVMAAWRGATAAIVPSRSEAFGQVAIEAMLAGAPVIAAATGGLLDIVINEVTGLLVVPGDAGALKAAMKRLLDEPQLTEGLTRRARTYARRFTAGPVVEHIESIYRRAIAAAPSFAIDSEAGGFLRRWL